MTRASSAVYNKNLYINKILDDLILPVTIKDMRHIEKQLEGNDPEILMISAAVVLWYSFNPI